MDYDRLIERLFGYTQEWEAYRRAQYKRDLEEAATAIETLRADLAQMTACVYYKPGGLCRYGGDDPANVCVLGPCPHERTAEDVLADLARLKVVFQPGYDVVSTYNPPDEDGLYTMTVTGVISKEEYEAALRRGQE